MRGDEERNIDIDIDTERMPCVLMLILTVVYVLFVVVVYDVRNDWMLIIQCCCRSILG